MRPLNANLFLAAVGGPQLRIPKRWTAELFIAHGKAMLTTIARTAKITQRRAIPTVAKICNDHLNAQIDRIAQLAIRMAGSRGIKANPTVTLLSHEDLWLDAIREVMGDIVDVRVVDRLTPTIQSVSAQGYSKTTILLGREPKQSVSPEIAKRSRAQARQLLTLHETTTERVKNVVKRAVKEELDVEATAKLVKDQMKDVNAARALTIARTELNKSWTAGSVISFQEDGDVTEVSVVGCESREEESWGKEWYEPYMWEGESTCNIEGVKVEDADKLVFHPNHQGVIVPSGFRE